MARDIEGLLREYDPSSLDLILRATERLLAVRMEGRLRFAASGSRRFENGVNLPVMNRDVKRFRHWSCADDDHEEAVQLMVRPEDAFTNALNVHNGRNWIRV